MTSSIMRSCENNPVRQFLANPTSKALAIKAKCAECFGCTHDHLEKGFRVSISNCSSYACPLHRFRPFQSNGGAGSPQNTHLADVE